MRRSAVLAVLILAAAPLFAAAASMPPAGSPKNPASQHVVPRYLEHGAEEAGAENIVTSIILNYRGYDTNGEVTVIFTSLIAVMAVLSVRRQVARGRKPKRTPASPVVLFVVRVIAPFVLVFSVYVIANGHISPGGGFQGGTVLGALLIAASLVLGNEAVGRWFPERSRPWIQPVAVLAFIAVGIAGLFWGHYLAFPSDPSLAWFRTFELLFLEAGIGIGGAAIVVSLFWSMEEQR